MGVQLHCYWQLIFCGACIKFWYIILDKHNVFLDVATADEVLCSVACFCNFICEEDHLLLSL